MPTPTDLLVVGFPFRQVQAELQKRQREDSRQQRESSISARNSAALARDSEIPTHIIFMFTPPITIATTVTGGPLVSTYHVPNTGLISRHVVNRLSSLMI